MDTVFLLGLGIFVFIIGIVRDIKIEKELCKKIVHDRTVYQVKQLDEEFEFRMKLLKIKTLN